MGEVKVPIKRSNCLLKYFDISSQYEVIESAAEVKASLSLPKGFMKYEDLFKFM